MLLLLVLPCAVYSQEELYASQPWIPDTDSQDGGTSVQPTGPTPSPAYTPYNKFAVSGKPLLHNSLDDQESLETHSFVYLAKPPNSSDTSATMSPVMRVQSQVDRQPYSRDGDKRLDQVSMETRSPPNHIVQHTRRKQELRKGLQQKKMYQKHRGKGKGRGAETRPVPDVRRAPAKGVRRQKAGGGRNIVPPRPLSSSHNPAKRGRRIDNSRRRTSSTEDEDPVTLVNFGDWAAQWDELEAAWYYYNYRTGESTWNKPAALQHIPFKNPYKSQEGSQIPAPVVSEQTAGPGTVPDGEVTGYSPPVTADFQLPGAPANKSTGKIQKNLENHKVNPVKIKKRVKAKQQKYLTTKGFKYADKYTKPNTKRQRKVEPKKGEKEGKDYGWLDFLGLPKMKLPDLFGFNSNERKVRKAPRSEAPPAAGAQHGQHGQHGQQGQQGQRGKRKIQARKPLTPGQRGCYTRIHELLHLC